jgi:hypothetical protein
MYSALVKTICRWSVQLIYREHIWLHTSFLPCVSSAMVRLLSWLVNCDKTKTAATLWSKVYLPMMQEILKMIPTGSDTLPTPKKILAHTL